MNNIKTIGAYIAFIRRLSKFYFTVMIASSVFTALLPILNLIMLRFILNELTSYMRTDALFVYIAVLALGNLALGVLVRFTNQKLEIKDKKLSVDIEKHMGNRIMKMEYHNLEDPEILDLKQHVNSFFDFRQAQLVFLLRRFATNVIGLAGFLAIILMLDIWVLVLVVIVAVVKAFVVKKAQQDEFDYQKGQVAFSRKWAYYIQLAINFSTAKDVRIYGMAPFLLKKTKDYHNAETSAGDQLRRKQAKGNSFAALSAHLQSAAVFGYAAIRAVSGQIGIGEFTMYTGSASALSSNVSELVGNSIQLAALCKYIEYFLKFEKIPLCDDKTDITSTPEKDFSLEFKNVTFSYKGKDGFSLKNISIKIEDCSKLAVVGPNGSGKSTFIKLLCRLYEPQEGEILIGGKNIQDYPLSEYMQLLSAVFQDFKLLPYSIRDNIDCAKQYTDEEIELYTKRAGINERINELPAGFETSVYKVLDKEGVEFSGGESQKLAIARAICKDTPVLVMDEPTAALDPFAEEEIYERMNEFAAGRTVIYISHRMSSCKFCDKIAVFENGRIAECGTHDSLLGNKGLYYKLWDAQARYYQH